MRRKYTGEHNEIKVLVLDDEQGIVDSLSVILKKNGYGVEGTTSPLEAISKIQNEHYDLLILDYIMDPIHGDKVVEKIREFNNDLYIILLTGHKDLAPPLDTLKNLQIQAYCEKSNNIDQLLLIVESGKKVITQLNTILQYQKGLNSIIDFIPKMYQVQTLDSIMDSIVQRLGSFINADDIFIFTYDPINNKNIVKGIGRFGEGIKTLDDDMLEGIRKVRLTKESLINEIGSWHPIMNQSDVLGVIYIEGHGNSVNNALVQIYVKQVSAYVNFALLKSLIIQRNNEIASQCETAKNDFEAFMDIFKFMMKNTDSRLEGHAERVAYYSVKVGEAFELESKELELLKISALLHDVLQSAGADDIYIDVDSENYTKMLKHTIEAGRLFGSTSMLNQVGQIIEAHHERLDGSGYPNGLTNDEIPLLSKIIAVADTFDVLANSSDFGARYGMDDIKQILIEGKGSLFDSSVVDNFLELLNDFYLMEEELKHTHEM